MIRQGDYVQVEKVDVSENPEYKTPTWSEFVPGIINKDMTLPMQYTCVGRVVVPPEENKCFYMYREMRNGVNKIGVLQTSRIVKITEENEVTVLIETQNSKYRITRIPPSQRSELGESQWKE